MLSSKLRFRHFTSIFLQDFARLQDAMAYEDMAGSGKLAAAAITTICRAFKLPLASDVVQMLLSK